MGMDASVNITFLNSAKKKIQSDYIDCYKCTSKCKDFKIPPNAKFVTVCFSTEYDRCSSCVTQSEESSDNSDEEDDELEEGDEKSDSDSDITMSSDGEKN